MDNINTEEIIYQNPRHWGSSFWFVIESIIGACDITDSIEKESLEIFLVSLAALLPCITCREHYLNYISNHSIQSFTAKTQYWEWVYQLQKEISSRNEKEFPSFHDWITNIYHNKFDMNHY